MDVVLTLLAHLYWLTLSLCMSYCILFTTLEESQLGESALIRMTVKGD